MENSENSIENLLFFLVESLVSDKENIEIWQEKKLTASVLKVKVSDNDASKIIGKNGRIARALRVIVKSSAERLGKGKYFVDITRGDKPGE